MGLELKLGQGWKDVELPREAIADWGTVAWLYMLVIPALRKLR